MRTTATVEFGAMQKRVNLLDLEKMMKTKPFVVTFGFDANRLWYGQERIFHSLGNQLTPHPQLPPGQTTSYARLILQTLPRGQLRRHLASRRAPALLAHTQRTDRLRIGSDLGCIDADRGEKLRIQCVKAR